MQFIDVLNKRVSNRKLKSTPLNDEQINALLYAAKRAPIARGKYDLYKLVVITDNKFIDFKNEVIKIHKIDPFFGAGTVIFVISKILEKLDLAYQDCGCLIENMHLEATNIGLGSVYLYGCVKEINSNSQLKNMLNCSDNEIILGALTVGLPLVKANAKEHQIKTEIIK